MKITLIDAGKRFNRDWIFRHLSYEFCIDHTYAITGPNGSGKSTLLQSIAGAIAISEGEIRYERGDPGGAGGYAGAGVAAARAHGGTGGRVTNQAIIPGDQVFRDLSLSAPYLELVEEMTAAEFLQFHASFKSFLPGWDAAAILREVGLEAAAHRQMRYYSSGMKQRMKLAQAIFSDTALMLLDEPCTNLDADGVALYRGLVAEYADGRLLIVSSNDPQEYDFCEVSINIMDFKK
jgi:ABC-type multidrug transport system ATPase subunit